MNLHEALEEIRRRVGQNATNRNEEFPINTTTCSYQGNLAEALAKSTKR